MPATELREANESIKRVGRVEAWEKENRIRLHRNNWFEVRFQVISLLRLYTDSSI